MATTPESATAPASRESLPEDAIEVGRVLGAWGIQGGIKVKPFAADPQALFSTKRWYLRPSEVMRPGPPLAAPPALLHVTMAREQGDSIVATARELPDRNAAEALKGARVFVSRASFPTPDEGEYYWIDLIGLDVFTRDGRALGRVEGLLETGPHCVLSIRLPGEKGEPTLVPFVPAYVDKVDLAAKRIDVDWAADY